MRISRNFSNAATVSGLRMKIFVRPYCTSWSTASKVRTAAAACFVSADAAALSATDVAVAPASALTIRRHPSLSSPAQSGNVSVHSTLNRRRKRKNSAR